MAVKRFRPTTPTQRYAAVNSFDEVTVSDPLKSLTAPLSKSGGRNNRGRITMRRRGGGHKRRYRVIDFKRNKDGVEGRVTTIEYDPNRSAFIALVVYRDGDKRYILAPQGLVVGAIRSDYQKTRIEQMCSRLNIKSFPPLLHHDGRADTAPMSGDAPCR